MNVVVTGATGSAGSEALRQALLHPAVGSVTALVRCPLPPHIAPSAPNPKLRTILHSDFNSYPPDLMTQLKDTDAVLWCQGASGASVSAEALEKVSVDYPVAAAKAFAEMERKVVFCYLSAVAVKQDPSNCNRFTIGKGKAELAIATLSTTTSLRFHSFRPPLIMPIVSDPTRPLHKKLGFGLVSLLRPALPAQWTVGTDVLGKAMIEVCLMERREAGLGSTEWEGKGGRPGDETATWAPEEIKRVASASQ